MAGSDPDIAVRINDAIRACGDRRSPRKDPSKAEIARALGVSSAAVSLWVNGGSEPERERLGELADFLGVRRGWLAYGEGPMFAAEPAEQSPVSERPRPTITELSKHPEPRMPREKKGRRGA